MRNHGSTSRQRRRASERKAEVPSERIRVASREACLGEKRADKSSPEEKKRGAIDSFMCARLGLEGGCVPSPEVRTRGVVVERSLREAV